MFVNKEIFDNSTPKLRDFASQTESQIKARLLHFSAYKVSLF